MVKRVNRSGARTNVVAMNGGTLSNGTEYRRYLTRVTVKLDGKVKRQPQVSTFVYGSASEVDALAASNRAVRDRINDLRDEVDLLQELLAHMERTGSPDTITPYTEED